MPLLVVQEIVGVFAGTGVPVDVDVGTGQGIVEAPVLPHPLSGPSSTAPRLTKEARRVTMGGRCPVSRTVPVVMGLKLTVSVTEKKEAAFMCNCGSVSMGEKASS